MWRAVTHRPLLPGIARGAIAGAGVYAGKRIIGNGGSFNWWVGRELASLSSSEVANAGEGLPILQRAVIPVGPIRIHVARSPRLRIAPRLDLLSTIVAVVIGTQEGNRFALKESLATGSILYLVPETSDKLGGQAASILTVSELAPDGDFPPLQSKRRVISHELIHAAQYDFVFTAWNDAAVRAIEKRAPRVRPFTRFVDFNLAIPLQLTANSLLEYSSRPWEKEAVGLADHTP